MNHFSIIISIFDKKKEMFKRKGHFEYIRHGTTGWR